MTASLQPTASCRRTSHALHFNTGPCRLLCVTQHSMQNTHSMCMSGKSHQPAAALGACLPRTRCTPWKCCFYNATNRQERPGYTRGMSVCRGPCPSADTTEAMLAGRPCLTF